LHAVIASMADGLGRVALASALLCGGAAAAQIPTSTQDRVTTPIPPSLQEIARTDAVFRDAVACVVRYQPARTRALLDTVPGSSGEGTILYSFQSRLDQCYDYYRNEGRSLGFTSNLLRGVVAEIYYHREFPGGIAANAVAAPETLTSWTQPRPDDGAVSQVEMLHSMARCVTVRQPAGVAALLAADPFTTGERDAIRTLQPDLAACLDSGIEFAASRQSLRGLLAEAALHYAEASRTGFTRVGRGDEAGGE
jgi:hypothetical protein